MWRPALERVYIHTIFNVGRKKITAKSCNGAVCMGTVTVIGLCHVYLCTIITNCLDYEKTLCFTCRHELFLAIFYQQWRWSWPTWQCSETLCSTEWLNFGKVKLVIILSNAHGCSSLILGTKSYYWTLTTCTVLSLIIDQRIQMVGCLLRGGDYVHILYTVMAVIW